MLSLCGLVRASKVKERHKATLWGMYVTPRALHWQGRFVDEYHLVLEFRESGKKPDVVR